VPTYQYTCTACREPLEAVQSFRDDPLTECPVCGGRLRKVYSSVGIVFKGSGFYRTDSRAAAGAGSGTEGGSGGKDGASDTRDGGKDGASDTRDGGKDGASTSGGGKDGASTSPPAAASSAPAASGASAGR
jgi:putative FmdB family regulatory protein